MISFLCLSSLRKIYVSISFIPDKLRGLDSRVSKTVTGGSGEDDLFPSMDDGQ